MEQGSDGVMGASLLFFPGIGSVSFFVCGSVFF